MIVLRTPKGWTGPKRAPRRPTKCRSRRSADDPEHLAQLESWLRSYRPEELFDERGRLPRSSCGWLRQGIAG